MIHHLKSIINIRKSFLILFFCLLITFPLTAQKKFFEQCAKSTIERLQKWYDPGTGLYKTTGWWNTANAITALIDYTRLTGDTSYVHVIRNTFNKCKNFSVKSQGNGPAYVVHHFINDYYDDEGWWALAWIDFYDLTHQEKYLHMAQTIFSDMVKGWSDECGGGLYWKKPDHGKNSIENELFILTAARLHNRIKDATLVSGKTCLQWAVADWDWFKQACLINKDFLVEDGLNKNCVAKHGFNFTYNQGVILSGLTELGNIIRDDSLEQLTLKIAHAAMKGLIYPNGILKEPVEPHCNADAVQFKGIFMRHLANLYLQTRDVSIRQFILKNATHLWNYARDKDTHEIGSVWNGPFDHGDAGRQSAALDAINAAIAVTNQ